MRLVEFLLDRTALHAPRADWLRRAVQLLHHPDDARTVGEQADRRDRARELKRAEQCGFLEVTLTGVHLGAYGQDLTPRATLGALLEAAIGGTDSVLLRLEFARAHGRARDACRS